MLTFAAILTLAELIGLSPSQLRQEVDARPPAIAYLSAIDETGPYRRTLIESRDLAVSCSDGDFLRWTVSTPGKTRPEAFPRFVFDDDKLASVLPLTGEEPLAADSLITTTCHRRKTSETPDPVTATLGVALYGPWIVIDRLGPTSQYAHAAAGRADLSRLRLGQPPPGGLAAYTTKPPKNVTVAEQPDGSTTLTVDIGLDGTTGKPDLVRVTIVDGRVAAIAKVPMNFAYCSLAADRSMRCGQPRPK